MFFDFFETEYMLLVIAETMYVTVSSDIYMVCKITILLGWIKDVYEIFLSVKSGELLHLNYD